MPNACAYESEFGVVRQSTDLVLRADILEHIFRVVVVKLVGGILARVLE